MDKTPQNVVWFVVTAFIAAALGAFLGVSIAPAGVVASPEEPSVPNADASELIAAIQRLREDLRDSNEDALVQPIPVATERRPMEAGISTDVEELRALMTAIRVLVEDGNSVADPPPIAAFHSAGPKNLEAVREACTLGHFDGVYEALLYQPYQVALGMFGRPDGVDEKGRWMWWAKWTTGEEGLRPRGLLLTVGEGVAVRVEWIPQ